MSSQILNQEQLQATQHKKGPLLVLAGAGSGKTKVVTQRIANLLQSGVEPTAIIAVTFTNKAAQEMKERVQSLTQQRIMASTFHSLGVQILRECGHELGFGGNFAIYDEEDAIRVIKECIQYVTAPSEKITAKTLKSEISNMKSALVSPEDLPKTAGSPEDRFVREVYHLYQSKLKEYNALDFDDLIYLTVKVLQIPHIQKMYHARWQYILVDEYQDTNHAQYTLLRLLTNEENNVFAVGDPDQTIYTWRGANIENILRFEKDFDGAQVIFLEQNYRSTNHILQAANGLISRNPRPYKKDLWSSLGTGEKVQLHYVRDERAEARLVVQQIFHHQRVHRVPLERMVVFYRTNFQSRVFEDALIRQRIPYRIIGGLSFYQRREIKDVLALLRLLISPQDYPAFKRTINMPKRGLGPKTLDKLKDAADAHQMPILTYCEKEVEERKVLTPKQHGGLVDYIEGFTIMREQIAAGASLSDIISDTIDEFRMIEYLDQDKETAEDRKQNLDELIAKAAEWEKEAESVQLSTFLEEIALHSASERSHQQGACVNLMTLHNSKGLEFDCCFLVGMEEDLFPHVNCKHDPASLEEERRLCYVGMTRARKFLHLTCAMTRYLWGCPRTMKRSRFLCEIPADHIETVLEKAPMATMR